MGELEDQIAESAEILADPGEHLEGWASCPECGSESVNIVINQSGGALAAGLGCTDCGAHT